jgi:hypothetical protein
MIGLLQVWGPPLAAGLFTLWAGVVALAAEGDPQLPKVLAAELLERRPPVSPARTLHVVHLSLLVLAGAMGAYAIQWWAGGLTSALVRLSLLTLLLWTVGDLLPRLLSTIATEFVPVARRVALPTLVIFRPLLGLVSFADRGLQPPNARCCTESSPWAT